MTIIKEKTGFPLPRIMRRNKTNILNRLFSNNDLINGGNVGPNRDAYNTNNVITNVEKYLLLNILFTSNPDVIYKIIDNNLYILI
jgi:hypothetical protein